MPHQPKGLRELLIEKGVPADTWKPGMIARLKMQSLSGQCTLGLNPPVRVIQSVGAIVCHGTLVLVEKERLLKNGEIEIRKLNASISRELNPREKPIATAQRALSEVFKIQGKPLPMIEEKYCEGESLSKVSFPGLRTRFLMHRFRVVFPPEFFNPKGYVEYGLGETRYLVWEDVNGGS